MNGETMPLRVLPEGDGESGPDPTDVGVKVEDLRELYRLMALVRAADRESILLQRQGELAVYPPLTGQEAAQVGSAFALEASDWIFPSYRELGAALVRGIDLVEYLGFYRATWHGGMWDPVEHRFGMVSVPVASQILHAVGFAMGSKLDGLPTVAMAYFGDGATSEGDFHEGCNFAGVFGAPVVLFCQNNRWAISVPLSHQTRAPIYRKAEAYGFPGIQVDGNDVLAVHRAVTDAVARAREGTPTLIEALTYRIGPHSTADDATRYQPVEEIEAWKAREPVERYRRWLAGRGVCDDDFFTRVDEEAMDLAATIRAGVVATDARPAEELFEWVYANPPATLARQRDEVLGTDGSGPGQPGGHRG
jgi:2-oxoisovalerate dehydrogenase E1 component alpha subunit